jgi:hypothetical protein
MPLSPSSPRQHLVLPFAACLTEGWDTAVHSMPRAAFSNFSQLLKGMKPLANDSGDALSLSPPHERVAAQALGISAADGLIAWAALERLQAGGAATHQAWASITPCHWAMGREHATLTDPALLDLPENESRDLLAAMQPYFATHGITLHYAAPTHWLAEGEVLRAWPTASLDRVMGRNVDPWLPGGVAGRAARLLQNEMQMLLYTHPINDARSSRGLPTVNSVWISGSGALPEGFGPPPDPSVLAMPRGLVQPAMAGNWPAYAQAWAALNAGEGARLLALQQRGQTVRLSLCGESHALGFETARAGMFTKLSGLFGQRPFTDVLGQL